MIGAIGDAKKNATSVTSTPPNAPSKPPTEGSLKTKTVTASHEP
jgi:hypothetical protein